MGTLGHRNQLVSKPADRKITIKKPKFGKFARRAGLVAGIATGIIAPSLLKAQGNIKDQVNRPTDKQIEIMIAASGESTNANTYTVPDARPKTTEKPAPVVNKLGQTIIGEPFCDVRFDGETIIFENVKIANREIRAIDNLHNETDGDFQKDATIVFVKQNNSVFVHNGKLLAHYQFIKDPAEIGGLKLQQRVVAEARENNYIEKTAIISKDGSLVIFFQGNKATYIYETGNGGKESVHVVDGRIFTHSGAIYEDAVRGVFVAITDTLILTKSPEGVFSVNINTTLGPGPSLKKPMLSEYIINGKKVVRIDDPTMPDQYMLYGPDNHSLRLNDKPKEVSSIR